jgi:FolB domain-containing protein
MSEKPAEIEIKNMRVRAILGINDWERKKKQNIVITIKFKYDAVRAIEDDDVKHAVNYKTITKRVMKFVEESNYFLIETLTDTIFKQIDEIEAVEHVCITIEKPHALRFCDNLVVKRSNYE